jgi:aromatic ring-opening dioxygenase catalytic subunit (LigB family)
VSLVYAGVVSHAPGITARAELTDNEFVKTQFYKALDNEKKAIEASQAEALIIIAAEHFANFFMNNMPSFCVGMCEKYSGPIENPDWLKIPRTTIPGAPSLSSRLINKVMESVDLAYAEEWKFDHGIMVPLHFLTPNYDIPVVPVNINCQGPPLAPLHRCWALGESLRKACDEVPEKIAVIGTGGLSHWPATPDSGKINEDWDRTFLNYLFTQNREALLSYNDTETYMEGGQGAFEIRTYIATAALARGLGAIKFYSAELPIFAVGCTVGRFEISG